MSDVHEEMKVVNTTSRTVKTYWLDIEGGEVRPQPHSRAGKQYRVTQVEVYKQDGNVSAISLCGPVLRKDGSEGLNEAHERLYRDRPEWVDALLKGLG